jgi:hypothetical protein
VEHHRKQAKALLRAFRTGDPGAIRRAEAILGERARRRFLLGDAQHVVAREQGLRTWAELKQEAANRGEWDVDSGLRYADDEPVLVHVRQRLHRYLLDDRGAAARIAGRPPGWQEAAHDVVVERFRLNVDRRGKVFVPSVHPERHDELIARVAEASLALYLALLDLQE